VNSISDRAATDDGAGTSDRAGAVASARATAAKAGDHPVLAWGARLGYAANGVLHLLLAWLTAQLALAGRDEQASQSGALSTLADETAGQILLWVLAAGFVLLALWQLTELVAQHEKFDKAKAAGKAVLYSALAWTAFTFASGGTTSSNKQTKDFTKTLMEAPAGRLLVGAVGVAILGIAGYHVYKGWKKRFLRDLQEHPGRWAVVAGRVGYIAKGIALAAVGVLFVTAAIDQHAGKVTGLDGALRSMLDLPAGPAILIGVALGLAAFGIYSFARARYARV
jgi:hypothetical protein